MPSNIGIAFEDVVTFVPPMWRDFTKYARLEGHSIFIIGQEPSYTVIDQLEHLGFEHHLNWDHVITLFSFLCDKGENVYYSEDHDCWRCENMQAWWNAKARICFERSISLMFESNPRFFAAFGSVPTRLVNVENDLDFDMVEKTTKWLRSRNSWFEDYDGEIVV